MLVDTVLIPLVRRSLSMGITFVVSGNAPTLPGKLYNLFGERITFKQTNSDYYRDIVGRGAIEIEDTPGRGYLRAGKRPLLFQVAQPVGLLDVATGHDHLLEAEEMQLLAGQMRSHFEKMAGHRKPDPIQSLPEIVPLQAMVEAAGSPKRSRSIQAVLGQDGDLKPALFDLKQLGPHFAIAGPPLSGKTTTLYNWVLSLAYRYSPEQVQFVLIDLQNKFVTYGGRHRLDALPHVAATVSEIEQIEPLVASLKREAERLARQESKHSIFVIIDNFDDFSEEVERQRQIPQELAGLARRYGGDGLHFIIAGMLDSGGSELKRRVLAANYGLGLRTAQAVESLRVIRTPSDLRLRELPLGRGYRVKSGQPVLLQVALPYYSNGKVNSGGDPENGEDRNAQALDHWIERIQTKYPNRPAPWAATGEAASPAPAGEPAQDEQFLRCIIFLEKYALNELASLKKANGVDVLITEKLLQLGSDSLTKEGIIALLKETWRREKEASGMPAELINIQEAAMEPEMLLRDLENSLANGKP
jgi:hypothetical protein